MPHVFCHCLLNPIKDTHPFPFGKKPTNFFIFCCHQRGKNPSQLLQRVTPPLSLGGIDHPFQIEAQKQPKFLEIPPAVCSKQRLTVHCPLLAQRLLVFLNCPSDFTEIIVQSTVKVVNIRSIAPVVINGNRIFQVLHLVMPT